MTAVAVREFALSLDSPLETAAGRIDRREGSLLVVGRGDSRGVGEATPLPGWTESLPACRRALDRARDRLVADDPSGARAVTADAPAARHALTLALADREARRAGVPLYRHLGGRRRVSAVPVNETVGDADRAATVAAARAAEAPALKVKVGARSVESDVARLRAVREAVGPDVELRADANGAWTREEARTALDDLAAVDVSYVEQPLAPTDLAGHAALRGGSVNVALDESLVQTSLDAVLAADAADVAIVKPMVHGGVAAGRTLADRAADAGLRPVVTTTVDAVVARTAAVHLAASLANRDLPPCGLATGRALASDLAPDPAPVTGGAVRVPQTPGTGVDPAEVGT